MVAMQTVVARLLTDPAFQERFYADAPASHALYGLTQEEFLLLRRVDSKKLGIVSEGYVGKRFERIESAFPRTLRLLESLDEKTRGRYLARTQFPADDGAERATFLEYLRTDLGFPPGVRRFLQDVAAVERTLYESVPPVRLPAYRFRPEMSRPKGTPHVLTARLTGPLPQHWLPEPRPTPDYPEAPGEVLILRDGENVELVDLASPTGRLFSSCDGSKTVHELARGFGPGAESTLARWFRLGLVEDAGAA